MDPTCYNSYYEINMEAFLDNYRVIGEHIRPVEVMPVLKAGAYGMGTAEMAQALVERCSCPVIACAQVYEGLVIRKSGVLGLDVLVIGPVLDHTLSHVVHWDLEIPVFTPEGVYALSKEAERQGKRAKAQIKIETGMNRLGARPGEELDELIQAIRRCHYVEITGAFTHFAQATIPDDGYSKQQLLRFREGVDRLRESGFQLRYVHCCNTGATEWFTEAIACSTHVRVGSLVFGYSDIEGETNPLGVRNVLSWRSRIAHIRRVMPGESVGYDQRFKPEKLTDMAVVGVGFADGLFCPMVRQGGPVLVNDDRTRYIDTCMDQCFIDVTGLNCKVGDPVTFCGSSPSGKAFLAAQDFNKFGMVYTGYTSACPDRIKRIYL